MMIFLRFNLLFWACLFFFGSFYAHGYTILGVEAAPIITSLFPADEAIGIETASDLQITFDTDIQKGAGTITIKRLSDNTLMEVIDVTSTNVTISGSVVAINTINALEADSYYVQIDEGTFENLSGIAFSGIPDNTTWNFTTGCQPPTGLKVALILDQNVFLDWNDVGADDYLIWISGIGIAYTDGSSSYAIDNLAPGATYSWSVKSICVGTNGTTFSSLIPGPEFTTEGENACAQPPANLTVSNISTDSVTLNWNNMGASDYLLWVSGVGVISSTNGSNSYTVKGLTSGGTYSWAVKSKCSQTGNSIFSDLVYGSDFTTSGENACALPPASLTVTDIAIDSVTLNWNDMGVSDYLLWVSGIGVISSTNGSNSYTVKGLTSGGTYSWAVKSKCSQTGNSIFSDLVYGPNFTTSGENACALPPATLTVTDIAADSVTLNWADMDVSDYLLWVSGIGVISSTRGSNTFTVSGLAPGVTYSWAVKSKCSKTGNTIFSDLVYGPDFTTPQANTSNARIAFTTNRNLTNPNDSTFTVEPSNVSILNEEVILTLYPNPSTDAVNILLVGREKISAIMVMDLRGSLVKTLRGLSTSSKTLRLREKGAGIYFVKIITNGKRQIMRKVIIE